MNIQKLIASVVLIAAACSVMAEEIFPPEVPFVSTKTRAEVIAELQQAREQGLLPINDIDYPKTTFASTRTRDEVRAELSASNKHREQNAQRSDLGN